MTRWLLGALCLGVLLAGGPSVAHADEEVGLSRDGVHWSSTLQAPLFDEARRWVPGDTVQQTFWVHNRSDDPASLRVDLVASGARSLLASGDATFAVHVDGHRLPAETRDGGPGAVELARIGGSGTARVQVTFTLAARAGNVSQDRSVDLDVHVRLTQRTGPRQPVEGGGDTGGGLIPNTGAGWALLLLLLAALCLGTGSALVRSKSRAAPQESTRRRTARPRNGGPGHA